MQARVGFCKILPLLGLLAFSCALEGAGKLQLLSLNRSGQSGRGVSSNWDTVITPDGRYVVFASRAPDLANTLPVRHPNLYRKDLLSGEIRLVTEAPNGQAVGGDSPSISSDGRYIAFSSLAEEFTPLDRNQRTDVYLRDMETGTVTLVSVHPRGTAGVRASFHPKLSADGRYVAFLGVGSDLVDVRPGGSVETINVFWRDVQTKTTRLVSIDVAANTSGNADSSSPVISANGRYVAFLSEATNLVSNRDANGNADLFIRDMESGVTELVNLANDGGAGAFGVISFAMTPDGRQIVFSSYANDLVPDRACGGIYIRDLQRRVTRRVSCQSAVGLGVSADGRFVAHGDTLIFRTDVASGITDLVNVNRDGTGVANGYSGSPSISADGRYISFSSEAGDLTEATDVDRTGSSDVFVRDMRVGVTYLASANPLLNRSGNKASYFPVMNAAGTVVTFHSAADDLAPNDANGVEDVFLFQVPQDDSQRVVFPRLTRARGETTGFAVSNPGADPVTLTLTAFSPSGVPVEAEGLQNPRQLELAPGAQIALVDADVFGPVLATLPGPFWVRMETTSRIAGFYLVFNRDLSTLDGADVLAQPRARLVLPEVWAAGFTEVHLVNPSDETAAITIDLMDARGFPKGPTFHGNIGAAGSLASDLRDLFPGVTPSRDDYILVNSNPAVVGFEYFGEEGRFTAGLNGQEGAVYDRGRDVGAQLMAPQYAQGAGIGTRFSVVNLEDRDGFVDFQLHADGLTGPSLVHRIEIPAKGKIQIDDPAFFGWTGTGVLTGFVEVSSPLRFAGNVAFGDFARFASALPLVNRSPRELIFSHVASDETFFTGLAIVNYVGNWVPEADVTIEVVGADGVVIASKTETLELGARKSQLITEYFPELSTRALRSGYIRVSCPDGVAAFALFGTWNLSALSAIPGQIVR